MKLIDVILPVPINSTFTYDSSGFNVDVGNLVDVNFSGRNVVGLVTNIKSDDSRFEQKYRIKGIISILPYKKICLSDINFLKSVSEFNMIPIGLVFKMMFPDCIAGKTIEKTVKKYKIK